MVFNRFPVHEENQVNHTNLKSYCDNAFYGSVQVKYIKGKKGIKREKEREGEIEKERTKNCLLV